LLLWRELSGAAWPVTHTGQASSAISTFNQTCGRMQ
jgi:hypothetical protein